MLEAPLTMVPPDELNADTLPALEYFLVLANSVKCVDQVDEASNELSHARWLALAILLFAPRLDIRAIDGARDFLLVAKHMPETAERVLL